MDLKLLIEESLFGTVLIGLPLATSVWSDAGFAPEALPSALAWFLLWTFAVWGCSALAGWRRAQARRRVLASPRMDY